MTDDEIIKRFSDLAGETGCHWYKCAVRLAREVEARCREEKASETTSSADPRYWRGQRVLSMEEAAKVDFPYPPEPQDPPPKAPAPSFTVEQMRQMDPPLPPEPEWVKDVEPPRPAGMTRERALKIALDQIENWQALNSFWASYQEDILDAILAACAEERAAAERPLREAIEKLEKIDRASAMVHKFLSGQSGASIRTCGTCGNEIPDGKMAFDDSWTETIKHKRLRCIECENDVNHTPMGIAGQRGEGGSDA